MELFDYLLAKKKSGGGGSSDLDWSAIGYDSTPQSIVDSYNYAKEILENWDNSVTNLSSKFINDQNLVYMPLVDTSNATNMQGMLSNCNNLTDIPQLNTSNVTNIQSMFSNCISIKSIPQINTSKITKFNNLFNNCTHLETIPILDTSIAVNFSSMFLNCYNLTDISLDNILQMCINATSFTGTKTLYNMGIRSTYYPVSRIEALPHYQDFIDAGWTIGY